MILFASCNKPFEKKIKIKIKSLRSLKHFAKCMTKVEICAIPKLERS